MTVCMVGPGQVRSGTVPGNDQVQPGSVGQVRHQVLGSLHFLPHPLDRRCGQLAPVRRLCPRAASRVGP